MHNLNKIENRLKEAKTGDLVLIGRLENRVRTYFSFGYRDGEINHGQVQLAVKVDDREYYVQEGLNQYDASYTMIQELAVIAKDGEF